MRKHKIIYSKTQTYFKGNSSFPQNMKFYFIIPIGCCHIMNVSILLVFHMHQTTYHFPARLYLAYCQQLSVFLVHHNSIAICTEPYAMNLELSASSNSFIITKQFNKIE
jgi:hypothetical protein